MLKIKVLNSETLVELKRLELTPAMLTHGEWFVGRAPSCGLVLPSLTVSRIHARIFLQEGGYYFADFASKAGSRINNEDVKVNQYYRLHPGDIVRIGEYVLMIEEVIDPSPAELPQATFVQPLEAQAATSQDPAPPAAPNPDQHIIRASALDHHPEPKSPSSPVDKPHDLNVQNPNPIPASSNAALVPSPAAPLPPQPVSPPDQPPPDRDQQLAKIRQGQPSTLLDDSGFTLLSRYMPVGVVSPEVIPRWQGGPLKVICTRLVEEAPQVKTFGFAADPPVLFTYQPGQQVAFKVETKHRGLIYTQLPITSSPSRPHLLEITVHQTAPVDLVEASPQQRAESWLWQNLQLGYPAYFSQLVGRSLLLTHPAPKILFIAGGSGILSMISMIRWAYDTSASLHTLLLYALPKSQPILFRQELEWMAARCPYLQLMFTTLPADLNEGSADSSPTPTWTAAMLLNAIPDLVERRVFIAGSEAFVARVGQILQELKFPMSYYHKLD